MVVGFRYMQEETPSHSVPLHSMPHKNRFATWAFIIASIAVVLTAIIIIFATYMPDLFRPLTASLLPADLKDGFFLYQQDKVNTLYRMTDGNYAPVSLGSTFSTLSISRRGNHVASIQLGPENIYEVRGDTTLLYGSEDVKTSAAISPNGMRVAFAQASRAGIETAHDTNKAIFPTRVMLLSEGTTTPRYIGAGFSPFFISDSEVAWFSEQGIIKYNIDNGVSSIYAPNVIATPVPYPAPAVSRDAALVAWVTPDTATAHLGLLTPQGVREIATYVDAKSPSLVLGSSALYFIQHSTTGDTLWKYGLTANSSGSTIPGLPAFGTLIDIAL